VVYEQDYFSTRKYEQKKQLVERHILEVLKWASKTMNINLLNGVGKKALDVGCAYGYTSGVLAGLGYNVCGIDVSRWGIEQAKRFSRCQFLVCDVQTALPFTVEAFDLVTCFDVLEHLPSPEKALLGMFEACRDALIFTTPNKKVEKQIRKLMGDYDDTHVSAKSPPDWKGCITRNFAPKELRVAAFHDFALRFGDKLFFKSFSVPTYGRLFG